MTTTNNNNTLVKKYYISLIENIDFNGCFNNTDIKTALNKLLTNASKTMKKQKEPGDTSDIKFDEMKGAIVFNKSADPTPDNDVKIEPDQEL